MQRGLVRIRIPGKEHFHMFGLPGPQQKLSEVQEILLNKRQHYSASFLDRDTGDVKIYEALRYLFEAFLEWTPVQVRD